MLINANALHIPLADKSVHTIVTSPPYYGLRDYGTAEWQGGDPDCDHVQAKRISLESGLRNDGRKHKGLYEGEKATEIEIAYRQVCGKCGAIRVDEQIGLEQTPDEYITNLVEVFRECKRILRDDGTLWVNIGDSYCGTGDKGEWTDPKYAKGRNGQKVALNKKIGGLKSKDLIGIPWMLAFALRADGWYLRQDIIWAKPNPMPESVKDRCTKSHEYIFLLSKSAKYYYDNEAVREPLTNSSIERGKYGWHGNTGDALEKGATPSGGGFNRLKQSGENLEVLYNQNGGRNKRDVWTVTTKPYKGAHYATFPPDLIKPCILAGAPETCCAKCGAPYERMTEKRDADVQKPRPFAKKGNADRNDTGDIYKEMVTITTGYQPTCDCNAGTSSGIVFDPFVGSGTTVSTAIQLGRKGIGMDLNYKYLQENAKERVESAELPLLNFIEQ